MIDLDTISLPEHVRAEAITGRHPHGYTVARIALWTDRPRRSCPLCREELDRQPGCPVILDNGRDVQEWSQQHGCGYVNRFPNVTVPGDATEDEVATAADELRQELDQEREAIREEVHARLARELRAHRAEGNEVPSTSPEGLAHDEDTEIEVEDGEWIASGFDPTAYDDGLIIVRERDL